jgi:hypothetical protein
MEKQKTAGSIPAHTEEFLKKRKFYLAVPILILPFLTMAFWVLGGGKDAGQTANALPDNGIDMALPSAQFKDSKPKDKMAVYQAAGKDTMTGRDGLNNSFIKAMGFDPKSVKNSDTAKLIKVGSPVYSDDADQQSAKISAKLAQINHQLTQPQSERITSASSDPEVRHLHSMMKSMQSSNGEDPEMKQLNTMLTKIQAIQNPGSVKTENKRKKEDDSAFRAIPAVIDGKQKVMNGGTVKLMLTDSVKLKGINLPKGQLLFGACQITNQRLLLQIQNIRVGKNILPAALTVFSLDGMPGIPAPEAELGEAAAGGSDNALQNMQFLSMDQTIGAQAAAGGINAAKGLFSKKIKKIKVKLRDQFPILLKINK